MFKKENVPTAVKSAFAEWFVPKRGLSNPEKMTNPVWTWLIENEYWPHEANRLAGSWRKPSPGWCFDRYGQSKTRLDDGSWLYIGGEHEDFYDPDFYIYNDVTIKGADGSIEVYGYPTDVFQPTDFHSATRVESGVYIIGCLGYVEQRRLNVTPVYFLDLGSFEISAVETVGKQPSWLFKHSAVYDSNSHSILVSGGQVLKASENDLIGNETIWSLSLQNFEWEER